MNLPKSPTRKKRHGEQIVAGEGYKQDYACGVCQGASNGSTLMVPYGLPKTGHNPQMGQDTR